MSTAGQPGQPTARWAEVEAGPGRAGPSTVRSEGQGVNIGARVKKSKVDKTDHCKAREQVEQ
jgi:hypothetical protein